LYEEDMQNKLLIIISTVMQQDAYRLQLKLFLYEVKQQQLLSGIRSYLKLYSAITVAKLAQYMEMDEATLRSV
jgi:translation initiation factor 3 subunit L